MSRWISFIALVGFIVVVAAFFLRVMAEFLVPLFLAALLVVIFRPVHLWFLEKTKNRPAWSALLTTITVVLAVVLPFGIMLALAAAEGREIVKRFDKSQVLNQLDDFRSTFGLNVPHIERLDEIEQTLNDLRDTLSQEQSEGALLSPRHFSSQERFELTGLLDQMMLDSQRLGVEYNLQWPPELPATTESSDDLAEPSNEDPTSESSEKIRSDEADDPAASDTSFLPNPFSAFQSESKTLTPDRPMGSTPAEQLWFNYVYQLRETSQLAMAPEWDENDPIQNRNLEWQLRAAVADSHARYREFKVNLLGGPLNAWLKELVNPQDDDVQQYSMAAVDFAKENLISWSGTATKFLGRLLFGGVIAIVSVYFFLLDGPSMMNSLMQLSPMDDRHERELIAEFDRVSRAVVLATLVAAVVQGILAGLGFYFAGIQSVFLLTMLTMLLAMIPFFGAASVWVPVVFYLGFFENQPLAAILLFLYCALIVSTIDNIIKPYILHGQSNLHPLLALLSVLGGVTALGAIGIMIGPMLVAFLQTLLKILRDELVTLDESFQPGSAATGILVPGTAPVDQSLESERAKTVPVDTDDSEDVSQRKTPGKSSKSETDTNPELKGKRKKKGR